LPVVFAWRRDWGWAGLVRSRVGERRLEIVDDHVFLGIAVVRGGAGIAHVVAWGEKMLAGRLRVGMVGRGWRG